ncbi:MAG: hypothetical protein U1D55_14115 [Phycisphaerae bacterium]
MLRWRTLKLCVLLVLLADLVPVRAALTFYANWPFFAVAADRYLANPAAPIADQWVGLVPVERVWGREQGFVWFQLANDGQNRYGVARYSVSADNVKTSANRIRIWLALDWCIERW